jgi:hypothetical protein
MSLAIPTKKRTFEICLAIVKQLSPKEVQEMLAEFSLPVCTIAEDTHEGKHDVPTVKYLRRKRTPLMYVPHHETS